MKLLILHISDIHIQSNADGCFPRLLKVAPAIADEASIFAERVLKHLVVHYFRLFLTEVAVWKALCEEIGISVEAARKEALLQAHRKRLPPSRS